MPQSYNDVVAAQIENVTPLLTGMFDQAKTLYSRFQKIMVSEQSGRNNRMPMLLRPGGMPQRVDLDNGTLGLGSGPKFDYTAMSPVDFTYNIAWSLKSKFTTDSTKKAVVDTVQITIAEALKEAQVNIDKYLQSSGTGLLATATGYGTGTYTCANAWGVQLLRYGIPVTVWVDSTQAALQNAGYDVIDAIDYQAKTFHIATGLAGGTSGNVIGPGNLPASSPVWIYGIPYNHNNSTSGSFLGWTRSDYPEVRTPTVNANNGALTPDLLNTGLAYLDAALGEDVTDTGDWFWYTNPKLHYNLIQYMTMISEISLSGDNKQIDAGYSRKTQRKFAGFPIVTSINADPTRVDFFDAKNWIRAVYKDIGWLRLGGSTVVPVPNSTSYNATEISFLTCSHQFAIRNPRRGMYISNLQATI